MKQWLRQLISVFLLLLTLTACGAEQAVENLPASPEPVQTGEVTTYPIPEENRRSTDSFGYCAATTANGYYTAYNKILFSDAETGIPVVLCAQPGCTHVDESCQAWLGKVFNFTEYHGEFLATTEYGEGGARFVKKDITTGDMTVLETWPATETESYAAYLGRVTDNLAVIYLERDVTKNEGENFSIESYYSYWLYDLTAGALRELFPEGEADRMEVMSVSKDRVLVLFTPEDERENLLDQEAFEAQYGEDQSYGRYMRWEGKRELRLYDLASMEYTVIASTERDRLVPYPDFNHTYGMRTVYQCGDTLYILDLETGESSALLTMEGMINYWLMDEKAFFIVLDSVKDGGSVYASYDTSSIYWADLKDGIPVKLGNDGVTDMMAFSINYEGNDFFIGNYHGAAHVISKADFYADRYENTPLA